MKLLPYRRFTIETRLAPPDVAARLRDAVEPPSLRLVRRPERPFTGRVDGTTFDVMRSVRGRNSFRPRIRGTVEATGRGARLTGTMRLHELVIVFIGGFVAIAGVAFLSMVVRNLVSGELQKETLIPLGILVVLGGMTIGGFIPEARRAFDELGRIVDASQGELQ
jgi:hypothetical protein